MKLIVKCYPLFQSAMQLTKHHSTTPAGHKKNLTSPYTHKKLCVVRQTGPWETKVFHISDVFFKLL